MSPTQTSPLSDVHAYLKSKDKDFTADLPTFEQDIQDDAVRKQVYDYLKGQDKDFTASFDEFSQDIGVKKKSGGSAGASPSGAGAEAEAPPSNPVPPLNAPTGQPLDQEFQQLNPAEAGLAAAVPDQSGGIVQVGTGTPLSNAPYVDPTADPNAGLAELRPPMPLPSTGDSPRSEQDILDALPGLANKDYPRGFPLQDDNELVAVPNDYKGGLPTGLQQDDAGNQYFRRPLSDKVDGKVQTRADAMGTAFVNAVKEIGQGAAEGTQALVNMGQAGNVALGITGPATFGEEASARIEAGKGKLAPIYTAPGRQNVNTVSVQAAAFAPMVAMQVVQTLAPELRAPELVQGLIGMAGTVGFDAPIVHGARERARAAGLVGVAADTYTVFEAALTLGAFKIGGKLIGQAGDAAVLKAAPKEFSEGVALDATMRAQALAKQLGRDLTQQEQQAALRESLQAALPRIAKFAKGTVQQGATLPLAGTATTIGNQVGARVLGGTPEEVTPGSFLADRGREAVAGLVMGGTTEAVAGGLDAAGALLRPEAMPDTGLRPNEQPLTENLYELRDEQGNPLLANLQVVAADEQAGVATVVGQDNAGNPIRQQVPAGRLYEMRSPAPEVAPPAAEPVAEPLPAPDSPPAEAAPTPAPDVVDVTGQSEPLPPAETSPLSGLRDTLAAAPRDSYQQELVPVADYLLAGRYDPQTDAQVMGRIQQLGLENYPEAQALEQEHQRLFGDQMQQQREADRASFLAGAPQADAPDTPQITPTPPSPVSDEPSPAAPAAEPVRAPDAASGPLPAAKPHPDHVTPLTPRQQASNNTLDALDRYNALDMRAKKGKAGSAIRAEMAEAGRKAGLTVGVKPDFSVTVTREGKRVTRANEYTGTTPAGNHVPLAQRPAEARPFLENVLAAAKDGISVLQGIGVEMRGKPLSATELEGARQDIVAGKNTMRAQLVLDALENAHRRGYVEKSEGNGLATRKYTVPVGEYVGDAAPATRPNVPLSDPELDSIYETDPNAKKAVDDYAFSDGTIDYHRLANDEAGLPFLFDVSDETATKLAALARERAQQPTPAVRQPQESSGDEGRIPAEAGADTGSTPQGNAGVDGPASESQPARPEEVAPTLAEQNVAAKQEFTDALAEFRAARKRGNGTAQSSLLGIPAFSAEESAALAKMGRAAIKLGAVKVKQVIARMRSQGLTDDDVTDEQIRPFVKQLLTDEGVRQPKTPRSDDYLDRRSKAKQAADAVAPAGKKAREHPLHYSEELQAGLTDEQKYYTPRKRIENAGEATAYVEKHGVANAYNFLLHGGEDTMPAVVKDAMRSEVANRLGDESAAALKAGDKPEAARLLQQQLDIIGQRAQVLTESAQVLSQNQYAGDVSQTPERAFHDYVNGTKEAQQKKAARDAELAKPADAEATKRRKATVERVLADGTVRAATARVVQEATGDAPEVAAPAKADRKGYGDSNRLFTKERLAEARAKLKGLAFSAPLPAEAILVGAYHLEAGSRAFVDWSAKVVRDIGAKARPRLAELYEASKKEFISKGGTAKGLDGPDAVEAAMRAEVADNLADRIVGEVRPKVAGVFDPVQQMLETLTKKVRETLPTAASKPNSAREAIIHALQNEAEYADVFEQSKQLVTGKINDLKISDEAKQRLHDQLEAYYAEKVGQPFATRQVDQVLQVGAKELGIKLEKLVREHADVREASQKTLVEKLVAEAGLTPAQATTYAEVLSRRFAELATQKAQSVAGRILAPVKAKIPTSKVRTVIDKMSEAFDIADATTPEGAESASPAVALLSKMGAIPDVTVEDAAAFRALIDKVRAASKGKEVSIGGKQHEVIDTKARQRAVVDLLRYGSEKLKAVSWWDKTRALQYAFRLSGLDTQGRNLKANMLHTVLEQGIVTPLYNLFRNRMAAGAATNVKAYFSAQGNGLAEAAYTMSTGYTGGEQEKFGDNSPLETSKSKLLKSAAFVGRAMIAGDQLTSVPTASGRTAEVAFREGLRLAKDATDPVTGAPRNLAGRALRDEAWAQANEILYHTKEALADIGTIVDSEGLPELTLADVSAGRATRAEYLQRGQLRSLRIADLLRQARTKDNPEMMKEVAEYTRIQTLNNDPQGLVGKTIDALQGLKSGNKVADFLLTQIVPFMRVPANSMARKLEWGLPLLTAGRIASGRTSLTMRTDSKYSRELTSEEKYKMGIRAAVGTAGYLSLAAAARAGLLVITGPPKNTDEDTVYPPQSIIVGKYVWSYKDTDLEYPLTVMAAVDDYVRKQKGKGQDPSTLRRVQVAALHSAAWTVTQGPFSGTSDFAAAMEKTMQGQSDAAAGYLKRLLVSTAKTATYPAILNQTGQAWREWSGMPQRERKSNDLATELEVSWFGNLPYAEVGEDRINFAGQPIVLNRDGLSVWPDQQTEDIAKLLVEKGLMPPRQSPTDDKLMLLDPQTGDRVTPMTDSEFRAYSIARGMGFIDRLTRDGNRRLNDIRTAPTAKKARAARNKALERATEEALKLIEKQRAEAGHSAQFKLSKEMQKDRDAANYRASQGE